MIMSRKSKGKPGSIGAKRLCVKHEEAGKDRKPLNKGNPKDMREKVVRRMDGVNHRHIGGLGGRAMSLKLQPE